MRRVVDVSDEFAVQRVEYLREPAEVLGVGRGGDVDVQAAMRLLVGLERGAADHDVPYAGGLECPQERFAVRAGSGGRRGS